MKRLVIRAPNWLGDVVMALPAMAAVRARFADAHVAVAAIPSIARSSKRRRAPRRTASLRCAIATPRCSAARGRFDAIASLPELVSLGVDSPRRAWIPSAGATGAGLRRLLLTRAVRGRAAGANRTTTVNWSRGWAIRQAARSPRRPRPADAGARRRLLASHGISAAPASGLPSSVSRRAPPTVTPNAGRRGWWPRRSFVYHGRPALAACSSAPAAIATRAVR